MSADEGKPLDDRLADLLAAYDDLLASGKEMPSDESTQTIDPALLPEWNRLAAFLMLVEQAWPRDAADPVHRTKPAPTAADPSATPASIETIRQFGRFQILRTLGQGGFGVVFLAWDPALRRQVALKVPQPEALVAPEARKRFLREAHAAAGLDHPNIVPVFESGSVGTVGYIAAAYCPGPTLADWLARQSRPVPVRDAAALVATLARAVEHAHERGVLHRDLKPSNVLLQGHGPNGWAPEEERSLADFQPRLTDFSLAWLAGGEGPKTKSGVPIGSPPYMAREQAEGRLDAIGPATDVYGLGCILYELLTGSPPFRGESQLDTLRHVIEDDPLPPRRIRRDIPAALGAIVLKCLEKEPARRYPGARELVEDLDRFLAGEPTRARPPGRWETIRRKVKRHPVAVIVLVLTTVFCGALSVGGYWFKTWLDEARRIARQRGQDARDRDLAARRTRYVADVRQAAQFVRNLQTDRAMELLQRHHAWPGADDLREFAWYHLLRRCHTERLTLVGHRGEVYHAEFSPDGRVLASSGQDGTVRLWNPTTGSLIRTIQAHPSEVNWVRFSPDGRTLATTSDDGTVRIWRADDDSKPLVIAAHRGNALIVVFTTDGSRVISCGREDGDVKIWDAASGRRLGSFHVGDRLLENMAISPDGKVLAIVSQAGIATLWDLASHRCLVRLGPVRHPAMAVAFSHDGTRVATGGSDRIVRVWEAGAGRLVREYIGHIDGVQSVTFTPDDRALISAGDDGTVRLWDVATGHPLGVQMGHTNRVWGISVSPDGQTIASASRDGMVKLWDSRPPEIPRRLVVKEPLKGLAFSANGRALVSAGAGGLISIWHPQTGRLRETSRIGDSRSIEDIILDRHGTVAALRKKDGFIEIHDVIRRRRMNTIGPVTDPVARMEFDPGGHRIVIAEGRKGVSLWEVRGGSPSAFLAGDIGRAEFAPEGEILCSADFGQRLIAWNPGTGRRKTHGGIDWPPYCCAALSPDGTLLVTTIDHKAKLWGRGSHEPLAVLEGHTDDIHSLAFSPDGETLASGDGSGMVKLWDVAAREELLTLERHAGPVRSMQFSPDGKTLATCADRPDGTAEVFLWRAAEDHIISAAEAEAQSADRH